MPSFRLIRARSAAALAGLTAWATLIALGLAPSAAAVAAWLAAQWTGQREPALIAALVASVALNAVLAYLFIRARRYARALEADMELIGSELTSRRKGDISWLPTEQGTLPFSNATLETHYNEALALAASIGADSQLGLGWIALSSPLLSFNGFTESGQKRFRIWCQPGMTATIVQLERRDRSLYRVAGPLPWREDPSWEDLVRLSWAVESPFRGSVTLWPRLATDPTDGIGLWRVEYRRDEGGVTGQAVTYVLERGQLHRN